jgi:stearoyl-CoA desaturase (delta-9 desaturase)
MAILQKSIKINTNEQNKTISWFIVSIVTVVVLMPLTAFITPFMWIDLVVLAVSYALRVFALTAGYHRYFAHKTFSTSRVFQFLLAAIGCTSLQGGPLWWASRHRHHHANSDNEADAHSPKQHGFWHSHMGWFLQKQNLKSRYDLIKDFSKYPELRLLERYWFTMPLLLIVILYLMGGWNFIVWGFCVPTLLVNQATYCVNSLVHVFGKRRYKTRDDSRNNWFVALITFGEGWHNNHHRFAGSTRQGFAWYEIDITFYLLKFLRLLRIVKNFRNVPEKILKEGHLIKNQKNT